MDMRRRQRITTDDVHVRHPDASRGDGGVAPYRGQLRMLVATTAAPHGYTLTIWTCGAITTHAYGSPPSPVEAALLLVGASCGFAIVGLFAFGRLDARLDSGRRDARLVGGIQLASAGVSTLLVAGLTSIVGGLVLWPTVGFVATSTYLVIAAAQFWLAAAGRARRSGRGG